MPGKQGARGRSLLECVILARRSSAKRTSELLPAQTNSAKRAAKVQQCSKTAQLGSITQQSPGTACSAAACPSPAPADDPVDPIAQQAASTPMQKLQRFQSRSFYSNNRLQHVEDRILRFLANVQARMTSTSGRQADCWELFPLQQPAFDYADSHNSDEGDMALRVFSVESGPEGKRRFLVTSYTQLWRRYRDMLPQHRHYYEIIRHHWPCHLYFDLEYQVGDNPEADGPAAVEALLFLVAELFQERFGLEYQDSWTLELDSTTATKFSRHVIVRAPGAAFASNAHVGAFVREVCARARERREAEPCSSAAVLFVNKGEGETLFVDLMVYTRNRAFRLYLSSKAGKDAVLHCTGRFGGAALSQQEVFERALICSVDPSSTLLRSFEEGQCTAGGAGNTSGTAVRGGGPRGPVPGGGGQQVHYGPCPFPLIEEFITSVCKEGGTAGSVRSWALLDGGSLLVLNMRGNRWCGNVGRAHKSNGVFYVVDLQQGWWCQRCYDPECRSYRSPLTALPVALTPLDPHHCQPGACQAAAVAAAEAAAAAETAAQHALPQGLGPFHAAPTAAAAVTVAAQGAAQQQQKQCVAADQAGGAAETALQQHPLLPPPHHNQQQQPSSGHASERHWEQGMLQSGQQEGHQRLPLPPPQLQPQQPAPQTGSPADAQHCMAPGLGGPAGHGLAGAVWGEWGDGMDDIPDDVLLEALQQYERQHSSQAGSCAT